MTAIVWEDGHMKTEKQGKCYVKTRLEFYISKLRNSEDFGKPQEASEGKRGFLSRFQGEYGPAYTLISAF